MADCITLHKLNYITYQFKIIEAKAMCIGIIAVKGWSELFNCIVSHFNIDGSINYGNITLVACYPFLYDMASKALNKLQNIDLDKININYKIQTINLMFICACINNNVSLAKELLSFDELDLNFYNSHAFKMACYYNSVDIVKLILNQKDFDPNVTYGDRDFDRNILLTSIDNGNHKIVELLINNDRFDVSDAEENSYGLIIEAIQHHNINIINVLLNNARVIADIDNNLLWTMIITEDEISIQILEMFLYDPRVCSLLDPSSNNNSAIKTAYKIGNKYIRSRLISLLLNCPQVYSTLNEKQRTLYEAELGG